MTEDKKPQIQIETLPNNEVKSVAPVALIPLPAEIETPELIGFNKSELKVVENNTDANQKIQDISSDNISISKAVEQMLEETVGDLPPLGNEEQYKVIDGLKISIPLYNVYLNEADEWVRRLISELNEWSLDFAKAIHYDTVGLSHALAGSSATVGFSALSDLAKSLELAMERTNHQRICVIFNNF